MKKIFDVIEEIYNKIKNQGDLGANANLVITFFLSGLKPYKNFILISKEEYLDLLNTKLYLKEKGITISENTKTFYNVLDIEEIKQLKEKIEYLKLL